MPASMCPPLRQRAALLAASAVVALACGDGTGSRPRYAPEMLVGTWRSSLTCPFEGYANDYVLALKDTAGTTIVAGQQRPRACESYSVWFPAVTAEVDARTGAVRIETVPQCCTIEGDEFVWRFDGRFVDDGTISGSEASYLPSGARYSTVRGASLHRE